MNTLEKGAVMNIKDIVSYVDKSIVSKQLMKTSVGNVTLFAFDAGENLSEHTAPFDALVQVIEGVAEVIIAGKVNLVPEGHFIIMPANVPHAVRAAEKFKMLLIMIKEQQQA